MAYTVLNKQDFEQELESAGDKLVVIDFYANWCGPCKIIDPKLQELSAQYVDNAIFLKVNVDDCEDIAMSYNITSMPTFVFVKQQKIVDVLVGGNGDKLVKNIEKYVDDGKAAVKSEISGQVEESAAAAVEPAMIELPDPTSMVEVTLANQV